MEPILTIIALATLGELLIEAVKPALKPLFDWTLPDHVDGYLYLSLILGIVLAFAYGANMMAAIGLSGPAWLGMAATGLLIGRGSNFVHNVIERVGSKPPPDVEPVVWSVGTGSREWQEADLD